VDDKNLLLILAISSRALAQSAGRAGLVAVAIDAFGDDDARAACRELVVVPNTQEGFAHCDLDVIVSRLVRMHKPVGIVYGAGFEDCPDQLTRLAGHAPLFGAPPASVAAAKDPFRLSELCAAVGLRHPEIKATPPLLPREWILKRAGGSGGRHIRNAVTQQTKTATDYWQRRIDGQSVSLLFTCDKRAFMPLGWSEQWVSPSLAMPYRYGGAAGPVDCREEISSLDGLSRLVGTLGLKGLASADFIDDGHHLWLLEINPRPGATLDVFDDASDPLMRRHLCASNERSARPLRSQGAKASAVVYAEEYIVIPEIEWPGWVADRPAAGTVIPEGAPICTVQAEGENLCRAKALLFERVRSVLEQTGKGAL
jgi:predicted ATP-grasp superfamily ATP-dependent carboligase